MKYRKPQSHKQPQKGIPVQTLTVRQRLLVMRTALPYIVFVVLLIAAATGVLLLRLHAPDVEADTAGAPVRSGMATVMRKTAYGAGARKGNFSTGISLTFRIDGHFTSINATLDEHSGLLNEGQEVVLTYQIGKSGTYYVVDWQNAPRKVELPR
jgi:hypothetical protein